MLPAVALGELGVTEAEEEEEAEYEASDIGPTMAECNSELLAWWWLGGCAGAGGGW